MTFGEKLHKIRTDRDLTLEELGKILNTSKQVLSRYENDLRTPKITVAKKYSEILGVPLNYLIDNSLDIQMESASLLPNNIIPIPQMKKIPLLGTIACGEPILAEENIENYVIVDSESKVDFALKCKGDSMINARIFDGDIVYIHAQSDVDNGQIAAVLIDNEATLKKVYKYPNKLVLSPCNPMYDDLVYTKEQLNDIRILGKAVIFVSTVR